MSEVVFQGARPIGDTNLHALPVKEIGPAVEYYTQVLHFAVVSQTETSAVLRRGAAEIGLEENDIDPEQASVYFPVSDVDALHAELESAGMEPSFIRTDEFDNKHFRAFNAKEPYGVCFCFGKIIEKE